jgi:hypothetical protein
LSFEFTKKLLSTLDGGISLVIHSKAKLRLIPAGNDHLFEQVLFNLLNRFTEIQYYEGEIRKFMVPTTTSNTLSFSPSCHLSLHLSGGPSLKVIPRDSGSEDESRNARS